MVPLTESYDRFAIVITLGVIFPAINLSPPSRKLSILSPAHYSFKKVVVFASRSLLHLIFFPIHYLSFAENSQLILLVYLFSDPQVLK